MSDEAKFTTFIQWKGTDLCMDFWCPKCGEHSHFDGDFAYAIRCPHCRTRFRMPTDVPVVEMTEDEDELTLEAIGEDDGEVVTVEDWGQWGPRGG